MTFFQRGTIKACAKARKEKALFYEKPRSGDSAGRILDPLFHRRFRSLLICVVEISGVLGR